MAKYQIIEAETLVGKNSGKEYKKLTVKAEGSDNLEPRTTMFNDHPDYANATVGAWVNGTLQKKDSGIPIPQYPGKNYVNRTLVAERNANGTIALTGSDPAVIARLEKLEAKVFGQAEPKMAQTPDNYPAEEIDPNDIPF